VQTEEHLLKHPQSFKARKKCREKRRDNKLIMSMQMEKPVDESQKLKELVQNASVDPREIDRQLKDMQRCHQSHQSRMSSWTSRGPVSQNHGYGLDYEPGMDYEPFQVTTIYPERTLKTIITNGAAKVVNVPPIPKFKDVIGDSDSDHLSQATTVVSVVMPKWGPVDIPSSSSEEEEFDDSPVICETPKQTVRTFARAPVVLHSDSDNSPTEAKTRDGPMDPELRAILDDAKSKTFGVCEDLWIRNDECLMLLTAMAQGLWSREGDLTFPGMMFDIENDELLKTSFKNKATIVPKLTHLLEECKRRSDLFAIPRIRKSAKKIEIIAWLKEHPVVDPKDVLFLRHEITKTYRAIRRQSEESRNQASGNRTNWISTNWLRLYCAAIDDEARTSLLQKDDCMNRAELDGRNHAERPDDWYAKTAELYNSKKIYVTLALRDLHIDYAYTRQLRFQDLPGGPITEADVKTKLAESRAKLIVIISKWERSGNGFGMRSESDPRYGHWDAGQGDNRSDFLNATLGHKPHHLYLWHLSDTMGVLKNVLTVLSPEIAGDSRHCPRNLASTQNKRNRSDEPSYAIEVKKQVFRDEVTSTLKEIGAGMKEANKIQARAVAIQARAVSESSIVKLRAAITVEEDKLERFTFKLMSCDRMTEPGPVAELERLISRHENRLKEYEEQMKEMEGKNRVFRADV
jgi:hypothetical protein